MVVGLPPRPRPPFRTRSVSSSLSSSDSIGIALNRERQEADSIPSDRHHGGHRESSAEHQSEAVTTGASNNKYLHLVIPSDIVSGIANNEGRDDCQDDDGEICSMARSGHTMDRFLDDVADAAAEDDEDVERDDCEEDEDARDSNQYNVGVTKAENSNEKSDSKDREADTPEFHMYREGEFEEDVSVYRDEHFYMLGDNDRNDDAQHCEEQPLQNSAATTQDQSRAVADVDQSKNANHEEYGEQKQPQHRLDQQETQQQANVKPRPRRILYLSDSESTEEEDDENIVRPPSPQEVAEPPTASAQSYYDGIDFRNGEEVQEEAYDEDVYGDHSSEEEEDEASVLQGEIIDFEGYSYDIAEQEQQQKLENPIDGNQLQVHGELGETGTEHENDEKKKEELPDYYDSHLSAASPPRRLPSRRTSTGGIPPRPPPRTATEPPKPRRQHPQQGQTKSESRIMEREARTSLDIAEYQPSTIRGGPTVGSMDGSLAVSDAGSILEDLLGSELDHQVSQSNEAGVGDNSFYNGDYRIEQPTQMSDAMQLASASDEEHLEALSDDLVSEDEGSDELEYYGDARAEETEYDDVLMSYQVMRERQRSRELEVQSATERRHEFLTNTADFERSDYSEPAYDPRDAYRASYCLGDEVSEATDITSLSPWVTNRRMDGHPHSRGIDNTARPVTQYDSRSILSDRTIGGSLNEIKEEADENLCDEHDDSTGDLGPLVGKTLTLVPSPRSRNRQEQFLEAQKAERTKQKDRTGPRRRWRFGRKKKTTDKVKESLKPDTEFQERHVDLGNHDESEMYGKEDEGGYQQNDTYTDMPGVNEWNDRGAADAQRRDTMQPEDTYGYSEKDWTTHGGEQQIYGSQREDFPDYEMHSNTDEEALHEAANYAARQLIQNDQQRRADEQALRRKMEARAEEEEHLLRQQEAEILAAINSGNEDELLAVLSSANNNASEPYDQSKTTDAAKDNGRAEDSGQFSLPTPSPVFDRFACGPFCASGSPLQPERIANVLREAFTNDDNDDMAYDGSRYAYQ